VLGIDVDGSALVSVAAEDPVARAARELLEDQARESRLSGQSELCQRLHGACLPIPSRVARTKDSQHVDPGHTRCWLWT